MFSVSIGKQLYYLYGCFFYPKNKPYFILRTLCIVLSILPLADLQAKSLDYLYINAREGSSSGGHTALRFGNETFHFQHYQAEEGGILRLLRQDSGAFDFQYRYLDNRSLYQAKLELNDTQYKQLRDHFNQVFWQQKQQNKLLDEVNLGLALLQEKTQDPRLSIKAAGLFEGNEQPQAAESTMILQLQQQIHEKYGATFLSDEIQRLKNELQALKPQAWADETLQLKQNDFLNVPYAFASHYTVRVKKILLLQAIQKGDSLKADAYFKPQQAGFKLSLAEQEQLSRFHQQLSYNFISLLSSKRPDWGSSAFQLYARLLSIALALDSGQLVFLDNFSTDSFRIPYTEVASYQTEISEQRDKALLRVLAEKKQLLAAPKLAEKDYSHLEMLANYYYEREQGLSQKIGIRIYGEQRLAEKSIAFPKQFLPPLSAEQSSIALARLEHYKQSIDQQIYTLYRYNLFSRNCVTEIFATIKQANIKHQGLQELEQLTQNHIIAFIPFGSFKSLSNSFEKQLRPSFRHQQLAAMYREENDAIVYLREFNTLSSSHYQLNDLDSNFLFFTDDKVWNRPLLGAMNFLTAASTSLYGSLALPFDAGKALSNGVMGIAMSLPELVFFNIRKGSYKHLSPPDIPYSEQ